MRVWISLTFAGLLIFLAIPALAHHSFTSFWYMDQSVTIEGVVMELKLVNPHPLMKVEVTDASSQKSVWNVTGRATGSGILKAGWTADTVPVGIKVKVEGNPSRKEGAKALAAGKITKPDGSIVWFGGGGGIPQG